MTKGTQWWWEEAGDLGDMAATYDGTVYLGLEDHGPSVKMDHFFLWLLITDH